MKFQELDKMEEKELTRILAESKVFLRELRFKVSAKQHKNLKEVKELKHKIARIKTALRSKAEKK